MTIETLMERLEAYGDLEGTEAQLDFVTQILELVLCQYLSPNDVQDLLRDETIAWHVLPEVSDDGG